MVRRMVVIMLAILVVVGLRPLTPRTMQLIATKPPYANCLPSFPPGM